MLPKINKSDMAEMMESIEEYLQLHCCIVQATWIYVISRTIVVQTNGDYPTFATSDNKMIARMIHLPSDK